MATPAAVKRNAESAASAVFYAEKKALKALDYAFVRHVNDAMEDGKLECPESCGACGLARSFIGARAAALQAVMEEARAFPGSFQESVRKTFENNCDGVMDVIRGYEQDYASDDADEWEEYHEQVKCSQLNECFLCHMPFEAFSGFIIHSSCNKHAYHRACVEGAPPGTNINYLAGQCCVCRPR